MAMSPSQQLTNLILSFKPNWMRPSSISNEDLRFQLFFLKSLLEIIQNHPDTDFHAQLLGLANIIEQSEEQF